MSVQAVAHAAAIKIAQAELALFKSGAVLEALVLGQTAGGLTELKIGDTLVQAQLPETVPPGTTLQLSVKSGGTAPQLVVITAAEALAANEPPLPAPVTPLPLPPVEPPAAPPTAPSPATAAQTQPATAPPADGRPLAGLAAPLSPVVDRPGSGSIAQPPQPANVTSQPSAVAAQSPSSTVPVAPTIAAQQVISVPAATTPVVVTAGATEPAVTAAQTVAAQAAVQAPVAIPLSLPAAARATRTSAVAPVAAVTPTTEVEAIADNSLLLAQSAPRPPASMADLPKPSAAPLPATAPTQSAATPAEALAQMVPEAMGKQNSLAPLLQSLAQVMTKPGAVPPHVQQAALQVLAQRIAVPDGHLSSNTLEAAVARSGVFLEATLAKAAPLPGDAKTALLSLKGALEKWLGGAPVPVGTGERAEPPIKGQTPRATQLALAPLPDAPRELARALHSQTDAAISRVKLGQLASLPDADVPKPVPHELRMELPFLVGQELVMAQLQISRDGARREADRKRGWTMRLAMNFSGTGEVGAEVGILDKAVNVSLWAAEPETAEALNAALPDLAASLEAMGLEPGAVRVRHAVPDPVKLPSGQLLDNLS